jgi:hypothetical protein
MNKSVDLARIRSALKNKHLVGFKPTRAPSAADIAGARKGEGSKVGQPKIGQSKVGATKSGLIKTSQ